jgi:Rod binding domain-containing protein
MDSGIRIDPSTLLHVAGRKDASDKGQTEKAAEQFESFLIFSMLKEIEKAAHSAKKSYAEQTQMSLFYEKVADVLAKKGIGIREMITKYTERGAKVFHGSDEKT